MQNITITISGPAGSGKTTLALIIAHALNDAGLSPSLSPRAIADCCPSHEDGTALETLRLSPRQIVVAEEQTPRESAEHQRAVQRCITEATAKVQADLAESSDRVLIVDANSTFESIRATEFDGVKLEPGAPDNIVDYLRRVWLRGEVIPKLWDDQRNVKEINGRIHIFTKPVMIGAIDRVLVPVKVASNDKPE